MEKKESPNSKTQEKEAGQPQGTKAKMGLGGKLAGILKLLLGLCLLPLVYAITVSFINNIKILDKTIVNYFLSGIVSFLFMFIFIYEPTEIFEKGQEYAKVIFKFLAPLVQVAGYLLPVFSILAFIVYLLIMPTVKSPELLYYLVFILGFTMTMHLVLCAEVLKKKADYLKGNYIFSFSFIYVLNITLLAFGFNILFKEFSFVSFFNTSFLSTRDILYSTFQQLFL